MVKEIFGKIKNQVVDIIRGKPLLPVELYELKGIRYEAGRIKGELDLLWDNPGYKNFQLPDQAKGISSYYERLIHETADEKLTNKNKKTICELLKGFSTDVPNQIDGIAGLSNLLSRLPTPEKLIGERNQFIDEGYQYNKETRFWEHEPSGHQRADSSGYWMEQMGFGKDVIGLVPDEEYARAYNLFERMFSQKTFGPLAQDTLNLIEKIDDYLKNNSQYQK